MFFHHLTECVDIEIKCLKKKHFYRVPTTPDTKASHIAKMKWTENKRSLIELIYSLNQTTCINNGTATLKELVNFFSYMLNTELPNFHSTVKRMVDRNMNKQQSRSFFLDELREKFNKKLEDLDEN